jgi:hypothetical protein
MALPMQAAFRKLAGANAALDVEASQSAEPDLHSHRRLEMCRRYISSGRRTVCVVIHL